MGRGQTLAVIARTFGTTARAIAACNALQGEAEEGQIVLLPPSRDRYSVQGGESQTMLCGSPESFFARNGTRYLYPGATVLL